MNPLADLSAIGFTDYEAKVYIALLQMYPSTGYQLSKHAGIPRSMVYEALGRLDARGAVLKTEEAKATLYRPVPPDALLDRLTEEHQQLINTLRHKLIALYTVRDEGRLWTISGEEAVLSYADHMIAQAQHETMLVLPDAWLRRLYASMAAADERGVAIGTLLTGQETLDIGQVAHHPPHESQLHKLTDSLIIVSDEREVLIASTTSPVSATITTNLNMVQIGRQFVWMELFAQRIFSQIGPDLVAQLDPADRSLFASILDSAAHRPRR